MEKEHWKRQKLRSASGRILNVCPLLARPLFPFRHLWISKELLKTENSKRLRKSQPLKQNRKENLGWSSCASQITLSVGSQRLPGHCYSISGGQREIRGHCCGKEGLWLTAFPLQSSQERRGGDRKENPRSYDLQ